MSLDPSAADPMAAVPSDGDDGLIVVLYEDAGDVAITLWVHVSVSLWRGGIDTLSATVKSVQVGGKITHEAGGHHHVGGHSFSRVAAIQCGIPYPGAVERIEEMVRNAQSARLAGEGIYWLPEGAA